MAIEVLKNTFSRGELSPLMEARTDTELHNLGAKKLVNFEVLTQGGIKRRNGSRFIAPIKSGVSQAVLRDFIFSEIDAQVLEFGDNYVRFFKEGSQVINGGSPYEIVSPLTFNQVTKMKSSQKGDVAFMAVEGSAPMTLTRNSLINWAFNENLFTKTPAPLNPQQAFGELNAEYISSGVYKITPSSTNAGNWSDNVNKGAGFLATDVTEYRQLYLKAKDGNYYYYLITGYTNSSTCQVTQINENDQTAAGNLAGSTASGDRDLGEIFQESAFGTVSGYPRVITLYQNRIWYGATYAYPQAIWGSEVGKYSAFELGTLDTDSIFLNIDFEHNNAIQWLSNGSALYIGTQGEVTGFTGDGGLLTPTTFSRLRGSYSGGNSVQPIKVENGTYFASKQGERLFSFGYSSEIEGLDTSEVSILSEHLFADGIKQMARSSNKQSVLWAVTHTGGLISTTLNIKQEVVAPLPNYFGGFQSNGSFATCESVAVEPSSSRDLVYCLISRYIDGEQKLYVEVIEKDFNKFDDYPSRVSAWFLDSALRYTGAPTATISGLGHLIGQEVAVYGNGGVQTPKIVSSSGEITLDHETEAPILIGLDYADRSIIELMDIDGIMQNGTALTQPKAVKGFWLNVKDSGSFQFSNNGENYNSPTEIRSDIVFDKGQDLLTGWVNMFSDWNYQGHNYNETGAQRLFKPTSAMPLTILAVVTTIGN